MSNRYKRCLAVMVAGGVLWLLLLSGCATTSRLGDKEGRERIRGTWGYVEDAKTMEREYTPEGTCICRNASTGEVQWVSQYVSVDSSSVIVKRELPHSLTPDGNLNVENIFTGHRTSPKDPSAKHPVVGTWEYEHKGLLWRRTFTNDGKCTATCVSNGAQAWAWDYEPVSSTKVNVLRYLPNIMLKDGRLLLENARLAERTSK